MLIIAPWLCPLALGVNQVLFACTPRLVGDRLIVFVSWIRPPLRGTLHMSHMSNYTEFPRWPNEDCTCMPIEPSITPRPIFL